MVEEQEEEIVEEMEWRKEQENGGEMEQEKGKEHGKEQEKGKEYGKEQEMGKEMEQGKEQGKEQEWEDVAEQQQLVLPPVLSHLEAQKVAQEAHQKQGEGVEWVGNQEDIYDYQDTPSHQSQLCQRAQTSWWLDSRTPTL